MYYDLITSLPHLPYFEHAKRSPISKLRLDERLRLLKTAHTDQLSRAQRLVAWRPQRLLGRSDAALAAEYAQFIDLSAGQPLRQYVAFRMEQQTLVAALRRKQNGLGLPASGAPWGVGPRVRHVEEHWEALDFCLAHIHPWLQLARELLANGDALGLERLLMGLAWRRLSQFAEHDTFGFEAVFSYYFRWDILQAWLVCDAARGRTKFQELIEKVTHAELN